MAGKRQAGISIGSSLNGLANYARSVHTRKYLINHSPENLDLYALIEAQRKLTKSKEPYERVVGVLCVSGMLKKRLVRLTDEELGQLLVEYVSNELTMFSPEAAICEEAAQRMFRGIEEECLSAVAGTPRRK